MLSFDNRLLYLLWKDSRGLTSHHEQRYSTTDRAYSSSSPLLVFSRLRCHLALIHASHSLLASLWSGDWSCPAQSCHHRPSIHRSDLWVDGYSVVHSQWSFQYALVSFVEVLSLLDVLRLFPLLIANCSLRLDNDGTAHSHLSRSMGIDSEETLLHSLSTHSRYYCILHDLLLYCLFPQPLQNFIWYLLDRWYLHSVCLWSNSVGHMGSDVPSGGSDLDYHLLLDRPGGSRCLSEDSPSSSRSVAQASQDDHSTVGHLDHLCRIQWSMGDSVLRLSVWFIVSSALHRYHLWEILVLLYDLLVSAGILAFIIRTTIQAPREDDLPANTYQSSPWNTSDHAYTTWFSSWSFPPVSNVVSGGLSAVLDMILAGSLKINLSRASFVHIERIRSAGITLQASGLWSRWGTRINKRCRWWIVDGRWYLNRTDQIGDSRWVKYHIERCVALIHLLIVLWWRGRDTEYPEVHIDFRTRELLNERNRNLLALNEYHEGCNYLSWRFLGRSINSEKAFCSRRWQEVEPISGYAKRDKCRSCFCSS